MIFFIKRSHIIYLIITRVDLLEHISDRSIFAVLCIVTDSTCKDVTDSCKGAVTSLAFSLINLQWCSMVQNVDVSGKNIMNLDLTGTNFGHLSINCDKLTTLHLNGVCTQPQHTLCIR